MRLTISLFFLLTSFAATSQDLTGVWRGHFKSANSRFFDSLNIEDRYKFETQIEQSEKAFKGVTYSYKTTVFYGKASCLGAMNPKTKKVLLEETSLLEVRSQGGGACLMTCFLQYSKVGDEEFLEGSYTSMNLTDSTQCGGGTVFLRKVPTSDFYKEPFLVEREKSNPPVAKANPPKKAITPVPKTIPENKTVQPKTNSPAKKDPPATAKKTTPKPPPAKKPVTATTTPKAEHKIKQLSTDTIASNSPQPTAPVPVPRVLATRQNELVKTITSSANDIFIKIYDNGTVDNDTVSVYIDKKLVISKQRLTEQPLTVKVNLDEKINFHELVMVAENLGEIPPNTSLMVVNAGDQQHEVRITSTEQKNAVVHFRFSK